MSDVAAVCDNGTQVTGTPQVAAQWTYDAYGSVLSADHLLAHPFLHLGHKGLFFDRLDVGVADAAIPGAAAQETPRLVPFAHAIYHNRNRAYNPQFGRFMQEDPNKTAMLLVPDAVYSGRKGRQTVDGCSLPERFADGGNLYGYLRSNTWSALDPSGLLSIFDDPGKDFAEGSFNPEGIILNGYQSLFTQYAANLSADVDWAADLSLDDNLQSHLSDVWVPLSLLRGAAENYGINKWFSEEADEENDEITDLLSIGSTDSGSGYISSIYQHPGEGWRGPIRRTIPEAQYRQARAAFRAKKWQIWSEEIKANPTKYEPNAARKIAMRRNPLSANGERMVIHHNRAIGEGGDPVARENLEFILKSEHLDAHAKAPRPRFRVPVE